MAPLEVKLYPEQGVVEHVEIASLSWLAEVVWLLLKVWLLHPPPLLSDHALVSTEVPNESICSLAARRW
jgi:hypothetical protein